MQVTPLTLPRKQIMKSGTHQYKVQSQVEFTSEELDYLLALSSVHYDSVCRCASVPITKIDHQLHDHFLAAAKQRTANDFGGDMWLDQHQLQTLCKITEIASFHPRTPPEGLIRAIYALQRENNRRHSILNADVDPVDSMIEGVTPLLST